LSQGSTSPQAALRVIHVDMDAFYAAVEVRDDPTLAGRALIVGGTGRRGVVAACSYEARVFGVRSAMPMAQARRRCPHATVLSGRFDRYEEVSRGLHAIFERYTPLIEPIALDEAFLDVAGAQRLFGPAPALGKRIRVDVRTELGLSCSVGVAPNKFLAKLASEAAKPRIVHGAPAEGDGVVVVEVGRELEFLHPLPIEALWGVGPATAQRLLRLGVRTVGQLSRVPSDALEAAVGRAAGRHLHRLSLGVDERPVEVRRAPKSVGHEETWDYDRFDPDDLRLQVLRLADAVSSRLRRAGLGGRTVTLKVRYGDFTTMTRRQSLDHNCDTAAELSRVGVDLLARVDVSPGVRLIGLSVSALAADGRVSEAARGQAQQLQLGLDTGGTAGPHLDRGGWAAASDAIDAIRDRFGEAAVGPAALIGESGLSLKRRGEQQWGPSAPPANGR